MKRILSGLCLLLALLPLVGCKKFSKSVSYELPCDQSSGYTWITKVEAQQEGRVRILQDYVPGENGTPGKMVFTFTGTQPGTVNIQLYYIKPADYNASSLENSAGQAILELTVNGDLYIDNSFPSEYMLPDELS